MENVLGRRRAIDRRRAPAGTRCVPMWLALAGAGAPYLPWLLYWAAYGLLTPLIVNLLLPFAFVAEAVEGSGLAWEIPIIAAGLLYHALVLVVARRNWGFWIGAVIGGLFTSLLSLIPFVLFI